LLRRPPLRRGHPRAGGPGLAGAGDGHRHRLHPRRRRGQGQPGPDPPGAPGGSLRRPVERYSSSASGVASVVVMRKPGEPAVAVGTAVEPPTPPLPAHAPPPPPELTVALAPERAPAVPAAVEVVPVIEGDVLESRWMMPPPPPPPPPSALPAFKSEPFEPLPALARITPEICIDV